jgi:O-antigen/teichoic acid export membrane protein
VVNEGPPPKDVNQSTDLPARYPGFLHAGSAFMGYAGVTLAGTLFGGVLAIVNEALIARFLGADKYGLYAIGFMLARIGSIVAAFGMPVTVLHFLPVYLNTGDKRRAFGTIISSVLLPIAGGALFVLALRLSSDWFAVRVFGEPRAADYIRDLSFLIPLIAMTEVLGHIARGFGRALPYVIIRNLVPPLCYLGVLLYLRRVDAPAINVTYGLVGAYIFGTCVGAVLITGFTGTVIGAVKPRLEMRELYSYAVPVVLNAVVSLALFWTDLFQLGIFTNADTVGIYRACMQFVIVFDVIWTTYTAAVGPIFPVLLSERRHEQLRNTYLAAMHLATLLGMPVFLLVISNAHDLLGLLGPQFSTGSLALSILACGNLIKVSFGVAAVLLILGGKQRLEATNAVISASLNVALNYYLIPRMGLVGASIATTTSLIILSGLRLWQVSRAFPSTTLDFGIFRVVAIAVPLVLLFQAAMMLLGLGQGTGVHHFLLRFTLLAAILVAAIWKLCITVEERQMVIGLVRRKRALPVAAAPPAGR